jgi:geranylgeranyl pyrophosphate synthase
MSTNKKLFEIRRDLKQKGKIAMQNARKKMKLKYKDDSCSSQALRYFATVTLQNSLPVFPALISMSCEALDCNPKKAVPFGEAIVLISAAADLHDDVIDQSSMKGAKQTVFGKFGVGAAILAGDILLVEGLSELTDAAESFENTHAKEFSRLVSEAVFEICTAEALEIQLHKKLDYRPRVYEEIIRLKAIVPELAMKIGALIANGNSKEVEALGQFGRIYGINSLIIEEFADLLDIEELRNRIKNECPPLPVMYAFQNQQIKNTLMPLLRPDLLDKNSHKKIVDAVLESCEVQDLQRILIKNAADEINQLPKEINEKIREELQNLLLVPLKCFED